jgi:hypothetical protein
MMHRSALGDFVGGKFPIPSVFMGGMGDFVPGKFPIPSVLMGAGLGSLGFFVPGRYAVPQNPVGLNGFGSPDLRYGLEDYYLPSGRTARAYGGMGCGGGCTCKQYGMGDTCLDSSGSSVACPAASTDPITAASDAFQTWWAGLTPTETYMVYGAGAIAAYMLFAKQSGGRRR